MCRKREDKEDKPFYSNGYCGDRFDEKDNCNFERVTFAGKGKVHELYN